MKSRILGRKGHEVFGTESSVLPARRDLPEQHLTAIIVFTEDSFDRQYPRLGRSYITSSNNKAYQPNMGGFSVFASCLDGTDPGVRLEWHMEAHGNPGGWKVEDCYILEQMRDVTAIPALAKPPRMMERSATSSAAPPSGLRRALTTGSCG